MTAEPAALSLERPKSYQAIVWAGLIAGILDISAAFINTAVVSGRSPMFVLQSIASGLLGSESYKGGIRTAALGCALHFLVAFTASAVYYVASRQFAFLNSSALICGPLYGILVYVFMYVGVLPLTFHRSFVSQLAPVIVGVVIHIVCVGLPIALIVRHFSLRNNTSPL